MICSLYPTFRVEEEDMEATIIAWSVVLEPYDSNLITQALLTNVRTDPAPFAPSLAQLIGLANDLAGGPVNDELVISEIRRAIAKSLYHSKDEFESLSPVAQAAVGSPENLKAWAGIKTEELESVILSHLRRNLRIAKKQMQQQSTVSNEYEKIGDDTGKRLEDLSP